jgi:hypothetical protein
MDCARILAQISFVILLQFDQAFPGMTERCLRNVVNTYTKTFVRGLKRNLAS